MWEFEILDFSSLNMQDSRQTMKTLNLHNNDSSYPSLALKNKRIFAYISLISHKGFEISKYISNIVLNSDPPKGSERMDKMIFEKVQ